MQKVTKDLLTLVTDEIKDMINDNPFGFSEESLISNLTTNIVNKKKYRVKDFDSLLNHFTREELDLFKSPDADDNAIKRRQVEIELGRKVITRAKSERRKISRETKSKIDTNLLTHSPFFVGGSRSRNAKAKKEGYIKLDKFGAKKITYENKLGELLRTNDARTLMGLFSIWEEQGLKEWFSFTEYELLEELNLGKGGRQYNDLRASLDKLKNTSVVFREAYDKDSGKTIITENFELIIADRVTSDVDEKGRLRSRKYEVSFSPYIHKSFNNGYSTLVSLAVFDELENTAAQSIYLFLSGLYDMGGKNEYLMEDSSYKIPLETLYETMFLESVDRRNRLVVDRGCEELKNSEIIDDFFFEKTGNKYTDIYIFPSDWLIDVLTKSKIPPALAKDQQLALDFME